MPSPYYASEIVSKGEDGVIGFRIVHIDRLTQGKRNQTLFVAGQFNSGSAALGGGWDFQGTRAVSAGGRCLGFVR